MPTAASTPLFHSCCCNADVTHDRHAAVGNAEVAQQACCRRCRYKHDRHAVGDTDMARCAHAAVGDADMTNSQAAVGDADMAPPCIIAMLHR